MLKRILIVLGALAALILVVAGVGLGWFLGKVDDHLTPPPNPEAQPSIASYARGLGDESAPSPDLLADFSWSTLVDPPKSARAWTRWWWPGANVERDEVIRQLGVLDDAGFGGVEIQPFLGGMIAVSDSTEIMTRAYQFDTPAYYELLRDVIGDAYHRDMQVDLTHFSGWPPGGPEVNLEDSLTIMVYGEASVRGGGALDIPLPKPKPGPSEIIFSMMEFAGADFLNFPVEHAELVSVLGAKSLDGKHNWNSFNLDDTVTLDQSSLTILTDKVNNGELQWDAPEGDWHIIASYLMPSGEVPMGAAQKPQGFVVDHLRVPQVLGHYEYAYGERTGLPALYGKGLRGFFNDSLEFRLKRMSAHDMLAEFKARRGYDLEPFLPAIYIEGIDNVYFREILGVHAAPEFKLTEMDERIRNDYQRTLSELVIERFVETSASWAERRGLVSRAQSYGMDIDIIRALGSNTIPETEQLWAGGANIGLKFASSAAALYGRPLVSSESFVWINRDYTPTARRIKAAADKLFLAGINHIIYHGTPYFWGGDKETQSSPFGAEGWAPFSGPKNPAHFSSHVNQGNTSLWPDIPALNDYIARSQNLLRQGAPEIDVLVYYPYLGFHGTNPSSEREEALVAGQLPDADPQNVAIEDPMLTSGKAQLDRVMTVPQNQTDERVAWVEKIQPLLRALDRQGISWGWVNDHALNSGKVGAGTLIESGGRFQSIVLPEIEQIDLGTLNSLGELARQGVPIAFAGNTPHRQPGFLNAREGDKRVQQGTKVLLQSGAQSIALSESALVEFARKQLKTNLSYKGPGNIHQYRRQLAEGAEIYFFANQSPEQSVLQLETATTNQMWWFDASRGSAWPVQLVEGDIELALNGFESRFLIVGEAIPAGVKLEMPLAELAKTGSERRPLNTWGFSSEGTSKVWSKLPDWRAVDSLKYAQRGRYTHNIEVVNRTDAKRYLLDLGLVQGSASVAVNGKLVGRASLPPFIVDISAELRSGDNEIVIDVDAPLRNAFVGKALAGDEKYTHMERYADSLVAGGLLGPVYFVEVEQSGRNYE